MVSHTLEWEYSNMKKINVAIIGAGLIGRKRALFLPKGAHLATICDTDKKKAQRFAREFNCQSETDWKKVVNDFHIEALIISTPNKYLSKIAASAILHGKHVLVEKPGGRSTKDLEEIIKAYGYKKVVVMFGYNHRYHPAILKAKEIVDSKKFGEVLFIRAKYGHGGRLGYEKEWRFDKDIAGGGELLDQGSHLIDLVNYFSGELKYHGSFVGTLFWKTKLEDTSFLLLKGGNVAANLSATCLEWKNLFSFEIMLRTAKIQIDGLGRSYGAEKLTLYKMSKKMGPPKITEHNFPDEDLSWKRECNIFFQKIRKHDVSNKSLREAKYVLEIIKQSYKKL